MGVGRPISSGQCVLSALNCDSSSSTQRRNPALPMQLAPVLAQGLVTSFEHLLSVASRSSRMLPISLRVSKPAMPSPTFGRVAGERMVPNDDVGDFNRLEELRSRRSYAVLAAACFKDLTSRSSPSQEVQKSTTARGLTSRSEPRCAICRPMCAPLCSDPAANVEAITAAGAVEIVGDPTRRNGKSV